MVFCLFGQSARLFIHGQRQGFIFRFFFFDQVIELLTGTQADVGFLQLMLEFFDFHL